MSLDSRLKKLEQGDGNDDLPMVFILRSPSLRAGVEPLRVVFYRGEQRHEIEGRRDESEDDFLHRAKREMQLMNRGQAKFVAGFVEYSEAMLDFESIRSRSSLHLMTAEDKKFT